MAKMKLKELYHWLKFKDETEEEAIQLAEEIRAKLI